MSHGSPISGACVVTHGEWLKYQTVQMLHTGILLEPSMGQCCKSRDSQLEEMSEGCLGWLESTL